MEVFENCSPSADDIGAIQIFIDVQTIPLVAQLIELERSQKSSKWALWFMIVTSGGDGANAFEYRLVRVSFHKLPIRWRAFCH